jgi:hypothetical protein
VRGAVETALDRLPSHLSSGLQGERAGSGAWEPFGIPARSREERAFEHVRTKLVRRTRRLLDAPPGHDGRG